MITISGSFEPLTAFYEYTGFFHQAAGTVSTNFVTIVTKLAAYPSWTVAASGIAMYLTNFGN